MKRKGSHFERDLIERLWKAGFAAVRVAGSGSASYPTPDIVAGDGQRFIAVEVKMRKNLPLYLSRDEIEQLKAFAEKFGAKPYVALKLPRKDWKFFPPDLLEDIGKNYRIGEENYYLGLEFEDICKC